MKFYVPFTFDIFTALVLPYQVVRSTYWSVFDNISSSEILSLNNTKVNYMREFKSDALTSTENSVPTS